MGISLLERSSGFFRSSGEVDPSDEEARAGLQRKRPRANPGEVVLGARESFLERPRVRPREVVLRARESFLERPRVRPGEVVLGVRESFPDEPEAAIERR